MTVATAIAAPKGSAGRQSLMALSGPWPAVVTACIAIATVGFTYFTLSGDIPIGRSPSVVLSLIVANFLIALVLVALIALQLGRLWLQRRSAHAGARLHARLVAIFSAIAIVPAVLTAAFAAYTINLGMEAWFSQGVRTALDNSLAVAKAYLEEHKRNIRADISAMANDVNQMGDFLILSNPFEFSRNFGRQVGLRAIDAAAMYDAKGNVLESSKPNPLIFTVPPPSTADFEAARRGEVLLNASDDNTQIRAFLKLNSFQDAYLLAVRLIDSRVIAYQENTQIVMGEYERLDDSRTGVLIAFGLIYASVALTLLLAAVGAGTWAANQIVAPIGRLVSAAERVSRGDLAARVPLDRSDDEVATLSLAFNRMTGELEAQREELIESHRQTEVRQRFTEAVLTGVSAGVIGLDASGRINIINRSAINLIGAAREGLAGQLVDEAIPELGDLVRQTMAKPEGRAQGQIDIARGGRTRNLTVRVTRESPSESERGYVVTFDDITDLITAQRTSAWADVARRIAHEIKNPLTPIQLSAERLRRKYKGEIQTDPDVFEQCTQTIIRQVSDIGRMVDEFSSFARMPQPVMKGEDIRELVRHSVFLQRVALPQIVFDLEVPDQPVVIPCDGRLVTQALTNVLKNAGEAVKARFAKAGNPEGEGEQIAEGGRIEIRIVPSSGHMSVEVSDNGVGLPTDDRHRLTEPYVTKRAKGTGLGLAIVKKIMEDHQGELLLDDAPETDATGQPRGSGARVRLTFPLQHNQSDVTAATPASNQTQHPQGTLDEQKRVTRGL